MNPFDMSADDLRVRIGMTDDFLFSLTPQQRDTLCDLRNRYRAMAKYKGHPLLRACDVEAWVAERWGR